MRADSAGERGSRDGEMVCDSWHGRGRCRHDADGRRVCPRRELTLGNEGINPPFSALDSSGNLTGMEPELAREMCKRLNVDCEIVVMDLKALIPAMLQGKLDAIATQLTPTAERKERALFTRMILQNNYRFVVPIDAHYTYTKEGLHGVKIGLTAPSVGSLATASARRRRSISATASQTSATTIFALNPRGCRPDTSRSRSTRSSASAPSDGKAGPAIASSENATSLGDTRALRENTSVV